jgi:cellulose synthase/poly-beta-1,6-N-acetylglucosamine synthase-like glycosyltransferase/uncharacterized protein YgiM (DUF1202 family)
MRHTRSACITIVAVMIAMLLTGLVPSAEAAQALANVIGGEARTGSAGSGAMLLTISPTIDRVNLRAAPSTSSPILDVVNTGEIVEVVEPVDSARDKIGVRNEWVQARTQDGIEGYTAAWLYSVVNPTGAAAPPDSLKYASAANLFLSPVNTGIRIRSRPVDGIILDVTQPGEVIQVIDPIPEAADKIGVNGEWIQVRSADGVEGYTAAWLYVVADVTPPDPVEPETPNEPEPTVEDTASTSNLYLTPINEGIRIRSEPINGDVVGVASSGELVVVIEPVDAAETKIGTAGEWVQVQLENGVKGYTAAWLYTVADTDVAGDVGTPPDASIDAESVPDNGGGGSLTLAPINDGVRIREEPVNGRIVGVTAAGELVAVIEPVEEAVNKIGVDGEWVQVRNADGVEGYTAAWLYTVAELTLPDTNAIPSDGIPPLASVDPGAVPTKNSIAGLDILTTDANSAVEAIPPMSSSIIALDVESETAAPAADGTESQPADTTAAESTSAAAEVSSAPEPGTGEAASSVTLDSSPATLPDLVNDIVPVSIEITDGSEVAAAELAINGYPLAVFDAAPFEYDLDTGLLSEGDYRLTFTLTSPNGLVYTDDLYFEVVLKERTPLAPILAAGADAATTTASTISTTASAAEDTPTLAEENTVLQRVLLIDGLPQPFTFEFSATEGLVPAAPDGTVAAATTVASDDGNQSLNDILGKPITAIVPAPVLDALTQPRPTLAAIIILFMTFILMPQGFFTLYWMTYTWNNPEVADLYSAPKEFVAPHYSFTALLPARKEEAVIKDTIRAVDRIDYPDHLKEILILIRDEDDDETINAAEEAIYELGKGNIRLVTFTDGPRNKPNGLNKGLRAATNDVVCIFDAEDEPHPEIYNIVNTVMVNDEADVVQSGVQLMNFKSTWFSSFNVLEYFFWFKSGLHAFTRAFHITPLGGNTVFFKRHWMERIGGWDDTCLTEDADVGFRLTQMGAKIQIVYDAEYATQEETPDTVESFIRQRTRWNQGFYQIFFKWDWARLPSFRQKIVALYILLNSLLQGAMLFFLPVGLFVALTQEVAVPVALVSYLPIAFLLLQMITNLIGIREFASAYGERLPFGFTFKMILFYYPFQLLLSVAAVRAIFRLITLQQGWEKTAHSNLHRQGQATRQVGV